MRRKASLVLNAHDCKNAEGKWLRSYSPEQYVQCHTVAGILWNSINHRCKEGGALQRNSPTYTGATNGFGDFQAFAEWCQGQIGYAAFDAAGNRFQLDKDLLEPGNKVYCPELCVFVPAALNSLATVKRKESSLPTGVVYDKAKGKFAAKIRDEKSRTKNLGRYDTAEEAFRVYKEHKEQMVRSAAMKYKGVVDPRVVVALSSFTLQPLI